MVSAWPDGAIQNLPRDLEDGDPSLLSEGRGEEDLTPEEDVALQGDIRTAKDFRFGRGLCRTF